MANYRDPRETERLRKSVVRASAGLFLENGFTNTTVKQIAAAAGISTSTLMYVFKSKEDILVELLYYTRQKQFDTAGMIVQGKTTDKLLFYAAETVLQLHIVESNENLRDIYSAAYSLPKTAKMIRRSLTEKMEGIFKEHLPELETKDFYELEVASVGIMRGFMNVPCDMYFTMDRKVKRFLETTFLVYRVPDEKIQEAIDFVSQFDFVTIAERVIGNIVALLEESA